MIRGFGNQKDDSYFLGWILQLRHIDSLCWGTVYLAKGEKNPRLALNAASVHSLWLEAATSLAAEKMTVCFHLHWHKHSNAILKMVTFKTHFV